MKRPFAHRIRRSLLVALTIGVAPIQLTVAQNDSLLQAGARALADGRPQHAIAILLEAGADTAGPSNRAILASAFAAANDVGRARQVYLECVTLAPASAPLQFQYARFLHQNLFLPEAVAAYRRLLEMDPSFALGWFHLAQAAKPLGEPDSLQLQYYQRAVDLNPRDYLARFYLGSLMLEDTLRLVDGVQQLRSALELNPSFVPALERLASFHFQRREDLEAAAYYRNAADLRPANAELRFYLGEVFRRQWQLDSALVYLRAAVRLDPTKATYVGQLGYAFFQRKAYDSAAVTYRQAIALEPDNPQFHLNLALTYERLDRIDAAADAYRAAAAAHAPDAIADIYLQLGHLHFRAHRYREAQRAYQRALDIDPARTLTQFYLALAFDQADDAPAALRHYRAFQQAAGTDSTHAERKALVRARIRALDQDRPAK